VNLQTILMSAAAFVALAACTPAAETPAPAIPAPADIAAPAPESGPAAENTTDTLATAPPADVAPATPAAPASATPAPPAAQPATTPAKPAAAGPTKDELANGAAVFARTCAMCHGPTGEGTQMGVALTAGHDYATVKEKVTKGPINSGDKMPPLAAAMSPDDLDDVAKFVEAGLPQ
jgi:mono/diheme cytochrome c family protein